MSRRQNTICINLTLNCFGPLTHLTQCVTLGYVNLTKTLIEKLKVDPNMNAHDGRIGKEGSRNVRKATWKSTLLHITCSNGRVEVLSYLLR